VAGRIREDDIALVRERTNIAEIVGETVTLRNAGGGSLKGLCPFHDEKSPSFHVTPARGYYHCFGCGAGGDVITYVMSLDHLSFAEAVERLAERAGVQLRYEEGGVRPGRQQGQRTRLVEAHRAATEFYAAQLSSDDAAPARHFLTERGFDRLAAERFAVGFAPRSWDALVAHLRGRGFTDDELRTAGLARDGRQGLIDRFVGRLLWPIRDLTGDPVGFGARRMFDDDGIEAKYLNTPETPIFKKSHLLYGVDLAKRDIARAQQAVIVEGYTDVMACHLAGVPTAVATCGTAFGEDHIKILRRLLMDQDEFRGEVIFTFDGDAAGQRAALRAFDDDSRFVSQTYVAIDPDGLDPCDLRVKRGDEALRDLVARRVPMYEFAVRSVVERYDLATTEGQLAALDAAAPIVARIRDRGLRQRYAVNLDRWLGLLDEQFVLRRVAERSGTAGQPAANGTRAPVQPDVRNPAHQVEREVLKVAIQAPALAGAAFDALDTTMFTAAPYAAVREAVAAAGGAVGAMAGEAWVTQVRSAAANDVVRSVVTALAVEPIRADSEDSAVDAKYAAALLARIRELDVTRRIAALKGRFQRVNPVEEPDDYNRFFGELVALEALRRQLREQGVGEL
jgi:DNA primase